MREDFAVFILTYGRPDRVITYHTLTTHGYSGRIYLVVSDDDPTLQSYLDRFGDQVVVFSKEDAIAEGTDQGDNLPGRQAVVYARNACFKIACALGVRYFVELDDDYGSFLYRRAGHHSHYRGWTIRSLDAVFTAMVKLIETTPVSTLTMSQGGDHIGGEDRGIRVSRKAMNSFVCDTERPFAFVGRLNEDTNAYVSLGNRGVLFFTYYALQLNQLQTQTNQGGLTEAYLDLGTYVKSFYTVMVAPSCVSVVQSKAMRRIHHQVTWDNAVPKIMHEKWKRDATQLEA